MLLKLHIAINPVYCALHIPPDTTHELVLMQVGLYLRMCSCILACPVSLHITFEDRHHFLSAVTTWSIKAMLLGQ